MGHSTGELSHRIRDDALPRRVAVVFWRAISTSVLRRSRHSRGPDDTALRLQLLRTHGPEERMRRKRRDVALACRTCRSSCNRTRGGRCHAPSLSRQTSAQRLWLCPRGHARPCCAWSGVGSQNAPPVRVCGCLPGIAFGGIFGSDVRHPRRYYARRACHLPPRVLWEAVIDVRRGRRRPCGAVARAGHLSMKGSTFQYPGQVLPPVVPTPMACSRAGRGRQSTRIKVGDAAERLVGGIEYCGGSWEASNGRQ